MTTSDWLTPALHYAGEWLAFQMRLTEQPGCVMAAAHGGAVVYERAFGVADLAGGEALTPRHRFRVASHSKTFTAVAIMKLREAGRVGLDDPVGRHVPGLPDGLAAATIGQLLSHTSGLMRDGADAGHWQDRQPFLDEAGLRTELARDLVVAPGERLKYSNLGFGLLGLVVAAVTGEPYDDWVAREVVAAAGLAETAPDLPAANAAPLATGHAGKLPLGRRAIPGHNPTHALAAATGFVATAADLARFFAQLDPAAPASVLSRASRREMTRRHWRLPHTEADRHYGLGTIGGAVGGGAVFGHSGSFQGFRSRTMVAPDWGVTVAVVTNASDGPADAWLDGVLHILARFAAKGAPTPQVADWAGRWWGYGGATDLVPMGDRVLVATPALLTPLVDAAEIEVLAPERGRIALASGFGSHGEAVGRTLGADGVAAVLQLAGTRLVREGNLA